MKEVAQNLKMTPELIKAMEDGFFPCLDCVTNHENSRNCMTCNGHKRVRMDLHSLALKQFLDQKLNGLRIQLQQTASRARKPQDSHDLHQNLNITIQKKKTKQEAPRKEQLGKLCLQKTTRYRLRNTNSSARAARTAPTPSIENRWLLRSIKSLCLLNLQSLQNLQLLLETTAKRRLLSTSASSAA